MFLNNCLYTFLNFHRVDVSEGSDVNKTSASKVIFVTIGISIGIIYSFKFSAKRLQ